MSNALELSTPTDLELVMTRTFDAPARLVFEAWTSPEHLPHWLGRAGDEMFVCEVDLRVGGSWHYVWRLREGGEMGIHGVFQEVTPPHGFVSTEAVDGEFFEVMGSGTVNTFVFDERDGRTTLTCTVRYQSREARDNALQTGMEDGVRESYERLDQRLKEMA